MLPEKLSAQSPTSDPKILSELGCHNIALQSYLSRVSKHELAGQCSALREFLMSTTENFLEIVEMSLSKAKMSSGGGSSSVALAANIWILGARNNITSAAALMPKPVRV